MKWLQKSWYTLQFISILSLLKSWCTTPAALFEKLFLPTGGVKMFRWLSLTCSAGHLRHFKRYRTTAPMVRPEKGRARRGGAKATTKIMAQKMSLICVISEQFCIQILTNYCFFDDWKYLNLRKEKVTVAKQLRIVQDNRYWYRYICSSKKVKAENISKIQLSWVIFPLKCGAVARWR